MANKTRIDLNNRTFQLVLSAVMVALATVLSVIPVMQLPFGGSVTLFSQVPILAVSWILGVPWGLASGLAYGILQILVGGIGNFSYVQGILAYIILVFADYLVRLHHSGVRGLPRALHVPWLCRPVQACHQEPVRGGFGRHRHGLRHPVYQSLHQRRHHLD